jgi:hypothetical protein
VTCTDEVFGKDSVERVGGSDDRADEVRGLEQST